MIYNKAVFLYLPGQVLIQPLHTLLFPWVDVHLSLRWTRNQCRTQRGGGGGGGGSSCSVKSWLDCYWTILVMSDMQPCLQIFACVKTNSVEIAVIRLNAIVQTRPLADVVSGSLARELSCGSVHFSSRVKTTWTKDRLMLKAEREKSLIRAMKNKECEQTAVLFWNISGIRHPDIERKLVLKTGFTLDQVTEF